MSLFHSTDLQVKQSSVRTTTTHSLVLALACSVLVLVVASVLSPASIGHGIDSETWIIGP
jgi:hypothetical protein